MGGSEENGDFVSSEKCVVSRLKESSKVIEFRAEKCKRPPNFTCRVERFGKICSTFDDQRKKWVMDMGFGGLLYLAGLQLPRTFVYWLLSRIDTKNEMFVDMDGVEHRFSANQVQWVLGLPRGGREVIVGDRNSVECRMQLMKLEKVVGVELKGKGVVVTAQLVARAMGDWAEEEEEEFKMLFLLLALEMVLCPTQSSRLSSDLVSCVVYGRYAREFDWCSLVVKKLMESVSVFEAKFNKYGFVRGCGGCTIFIVIFYVDRLARNPVCWGVWPRVKVWCNDELRKVINEDHQRTGSDFGSIKMLDVAYGESHPRDARDRGVVGVESMVMPASNQIGSRVKPKRKRMDLVG